MKEANCTIRTQDGKMRLCNGMRFLEDEGSPAVMNVHPFVQVKPASRQTEDDDATSACTKLRALRP